MSVHTTTSYTNIPRPLDAFFGHVRELETLREWPDAGTRLVTIPGPPGMGKTRLALT